MLRRGRRLAALATVVALLLTMSGQAAAASRFGGTNLARGMRTAAVSELQRALTRLGYSTGVISGYFGPVTERQVRAYQRIEKLPVTGIAGPLTKAALTVDLQRLDDVARAERAAAEAAATQPAPLPPLPPVTGHICLTFNDAPDETTTPLILEALSAAGASATFFCTGERAAAHPELIKAIIAAGCSIGVHGWSDSDYSALSEAQIRADLDATVGALMAAGAPRPVWFRPPHGDFEPAVIAAGRRLDLGAAYWSNIGSAPSIDGALRAAFGGAILLLPDNAATARDLPGFLVELRRLGLLAHPLDDK